MKLPHHLMRTYRTYKEVEQDLLLWIEVTASESGYGPSTRKKKLKGRTRTLTRRANTPDQPNNIENSEAAISILEILPAITAIARNPRILSIPAKVFKQFNTILELRTACVRWFKGNTEQNDTRTREKNEKHLFPVMLLQKAIGVLESRFPLHKTAAREELSGTEIIPAASLTTNNPFDQLSSQQTHEETPSVPKEKSPRIRNDFHNHLPDSFKMTDEEKLQDEFNIAKFCLLRDIQEVEDFMILELVRYSLDQANADTLAFLSNTAIDLVSKMETLLYERFDFKTFELGFDANFVLPTGHLLLSSPQLRMQNVIAAAWRKRKCLAKQETFHPASTEFEPHLPYFHATIEQQMAIEQHFFEKLLCIQEDEDPQHFVFYSEIIVGFLKCVAGPEFIGYCYQSVPFYGTFGIRIALLATLILRDKPLLSLGLLSGTGLEYARLESCRGEFWGTHDYRSRRVASLWFSLRPVLERQTSSYENYENSIIGGKNALSAHHIMCAWNHCHLRMRYAITSIAAMEISNVAKILAHLWNLLREENKGDHIWLDMDYLLSVLGEEYMFQATRPVSVRDNPEAIRSRIMYGMDFVKKDVPDGLRSLRRHKSPRSKLRHKHRFNTSNFPLYTQLTKRSDGLLGALDGAIDAELVATATVIPEILGCKPTLVVFNEDRQMENKPSLWKLRDQGPGLQSVELLAVVKKGLQKEFRTLDFDYLSFEKASHRLVDMMHQSLTTLITSLSEIKSTTSLLHKLEFVMFHVIDNTNAQLLQEISAIFERWLPQNGHVGVKGLRIFEQRPVDLKTQISSLRPEILGIVESIVKRRGLRKDVFSQDQLDVKSIAVTGNVDDMIKAAWANHNVQRKTTKLETGRFVHPDLDLR